MVALLLLCTCGPLTAEQALARADAVFQGTVLETAPQETPSRSECAPPGEGPAAPREAKRGCLDGFVWSARTCSPLAGAPVVAKPAQGEGTTGVTDKDGHYQICELEPGAYRVEASFDFSRREEEANVVAGEVRMLHFALELSPLEKARFQVDQPFKGLVGAEKQVMVLTNRNTAACGFGSFDVGKSYVVYASRQRGNLYTGLCDGTKPSENASVDLGVLRAPRKGGCAGCAAGQGGAAGGGALVALLVAALTATRGRSARRRAARRRG